MNCDNCKFADWKRTANGRLHPDKSGKCQYLEKHPLDMRIPAAFNWDYSCSNVPPKPNWGQIERGRDLRRDCEFKATE